MTKRTIALLSCALALTTVATAAADNRRPVAQASQRAKALTLSVGVSGATMVPGDLPFTWYANPSGGTPPYTYQWYVSGSDGGTGGSVTTSLTPPDAYLYVEVTDSQSGFASGGLYVTVCPNGQYTC
jgi:hypothetical protein